MKNLITIDTGTTNTRVVLWQNERAVDFEKSSVGVRNTAISGSKKVLQEAIAGALKALLERNNITNHKDVVVFASGMITSNVGLVVVNHLTTPVGIKELAAGMRKIMISEVFDEPIWFVPGIKNNQGNITPENITDMDVMRGEEVEAIGAVNLLGIKVPAILILPGSHTKIIKVDADKKIVGSVTSMTGELLDILTKNSILAESVRDDFIEELDLDALKLGAQTAKVNGLGRTAFSVRLLGMYTDFTRNQRANFLEGAVLENDLEATKKTTAFTVAKDEAIVIIGKPGLRDGLKVLFENDPMFNGQVSTQEVENLAGKGVLQIAKERKLFN